MNEILNNDFIGSIVNDLNLEMDESEINSLIDQAKKDNEEKKKKEDEDKK